MSARDVSHEFMRQSIASPDTATTYNPWREGDDKTLSSFGGRTASADPYHPNDNRTRVPSNRQGPFLSETADPTITSSPDWQATLKSLARPARHTPRPPVVLKTSGGSENVLSLQHTTIDPAEFPHIDTSKIAYRLPTTFPAYVQYISVEILSIKEFSAKPILDIKRNSRTSVILYSIELLAIILRSKQGGLVTSEVIVWQGRHHPNATSQEQAKIVELERRYRTNSKTVIQGCEDQSFVNAVGGTVVIRNGSRESFDLLNTTLYRIQRVGRAGAAIDEIDLVRRPSLKQRMNGTKPPDN